MFLKVTHYFILISLIVNSSQAFSLLSCKEVFEFFKISTHSKASFKPPPSTNREAQLARQGFSRKFTASIDLVNEWAVVRRQLQEQQADPYTTHIEYFADQIPDHIQYIRKSIEAILASSNSKRHWSIEGLDESLKALKKLEKKAKKAIKNKKVTYKWWLEFNIDLTRLMSGRYYNKWRGSYHYFRANPNSFEIDKIKPHLSQFPFSILIPTISGEDIGIIAFRKARENSVYPIGIINTPYTTIDKNEISAYDTIIHDIIHASFPANMRLRGINVFDERLGDNIENLPPDKRKKAEMIYFLMTHENGKMDVNRYPYFTPQQMKAEVIKSIRNDVAGLFNFPDDPIQKQKKIEDLADTFMEVYNREQQHQE